MYLEREYGPFSFKRKAGEHFSDVLTKELNKYYDTYFTSSRKAKRLLADKLGLSTRSLRDWMSKKMRKEKEIAEKTRQYQTAYEQEPNISVTGMLIYILRGTTVSLIYIYLLYIYIYIYIFIYIFIYLYMYIFVHKYC